MTITEQLASGMFALFAFGVSSLVQLGLLAVEASLQQ
jgi:hypothetical protein